MIVDSSTWKHVFKLDPDREIADEALERICLSGTDAILVGGSSGVTFDNTVDLLARIRGFEVPCILEVSDAEAIVPGFDLFFIPMVLNAGDPQWILGRHHEALKEYGAIMDWNEILVEGYVILNGESTAAKVTSARTDLTERDVVAYARMAEHLLRLPIFYVEYSGTFGDMELVRRTRRVLEGTRLFYGGGIDGPEKAKLAAEAADTIVVGNLIYEDLDLALETVRALI
ncbi:MULTISPECIES: heptaprenylglyceryl phosphate synthase [Paenibacillus]|uniref:heptaprenylglyceryl phosphate synthase n=1 Tax=Paenibacillus TaxID=44249 RepID=UPI00020D7751|nr:MULTISPECIES: heptaprenylglyceryl phosphate synthase [Paenibacillus]EGL17414.1 geranylgeranylglyceryl phosphate synthase family protein [Paenibacillus sp. HGF7]EPD86302.1 geranylgeranylglyceryl phosphate synthase [Paenibacillus sp. HGH0039]MBV6716730.1 heptaprenylglyceryl phosphate synthase [Paenibacillus chitinolyticus]